MSDSPYNIKLLLVDDDESFLSLFVQAAKVQGRDRQCEIITAGSGEEALDLVGKTAPNVVVTDIQMPGLGGMNLFLKLGDRYPGLPVILMTAFGSVDRAVEAMKKGAYYYFQKPLSDLELFWKTVFEAAAKKRIAEELEGFRRDQEGSGPGSRMIGSSPAWMKAVEAVNRVAPLPSTVLISGETGTGKEVAARAIHRFSGRAGRTFIAVSCAEFAGSLLETELFGHERGAFTGAVNRRLGIFERAHGGTLFLDEIAQTSPEMQGKLLRVLEGSSFHRVGGQEPIVSDFRLIAATNQDLEGLVQADRFRQDLYFRLAVYPIKLPPLRERPEDLAPLARHFLQKTARKLRRPPKTMSGSAMLILHRHDWPGNVRELENLIERAVITSAGQEILSADLFPEAPLASAPGPGFKLEDMERLMIEIALEKSGQNKSKAAESLGISRKTINDKINRYSMKTT
ncbi:MAG: sigma-54 dependent transcriptional regulator [Thermodesulfobacteriota bacterium]|nr:sigma-54 dependent transcriptional regulator [Thermodesulfobacteriota bacterium]